jgi:pyruvate-formate lyase-activating enzyme
MRDAATSLFDSVAFHLTDRCNISCAHCMPDSGPTRRTTMAGPDLAAWLEALVAMGRTRKICLTGGEPFVVPELLDLASRVAQRAGIECAVMTNGSWGSSVAGAKRILERFDGITKIGLSTDHFHREFVPSEKIRNVIEACRELGKQVLVRVAYLDEAEEEVSTTVQQLGGCAAHLVDLEAQPVVHLGRARRRFGRSDLFQMPPEALADACRVADTPVVTPDGDVFACCGPSMQMHPDSALRLGSLRERSMRQIASEAESNTILHFVRAIGPRELLQELLDRDAAIELERPAHICELCAACFSTVDARRLVTAVAAEESVRHRVEMARLVRLGEVAAKDGALDHLT